MHFGSGCLIHFNIIQHSILDASTNLHLEHWPRLTPTSQSIINLKLQHPIFTLYIDTAGHPNTSRSIATIKNLMVKNKCKTIGFRILCFQNSKWNVGRFTHLHLLSNQVLKDLKRSVCRSSCIVYGTTGNPRREE